MTNREAKKVLRAHRLPEDSQVFVQNCLYVLPVGAISSGVCLNRTSDRYYCKLTVFHQPLYKPFDCVAFWQSSDILTPENGYDWPFDPDPQSPAAIALCEAIRNLCLPLARQRLTVEGALAKSREQLAHYPDSLYDQEDQVLSLCMLGRFDEAWSVLEPMMAIVRDYVENPRPLPKPFDWNLVDRNQSTAENLYPLLLPLEEAFLARDREQAVMRQMELYIEGTKKAVGLSGVQ